MSFFQKNAKTIFKLKNLNEKTFFYKQLEPLKRTEKELRKPIYARLDLKKKCKLQFFQEMQSCEKCKLTTSVTY